MKRTEGNGTIMSQRKKPPAFRVDQPVTWRDLIVGLHGLLTTATLHNQIGWPVTAAAAVGLTSPVTWVMMSRR
ncbi:hypothetical protein [Kitasatospora sp. MAP5-34]|uniref:hypothetical protein n=1 Tax=Kitasatospora sp. MAP5-34 TaxID=3035102 RepID=UPI00247361B3|nr:hypothetical protein [Kitasatospora sp. MAP5-34]